MQKAAEEKIKAGVLRCGRHVVGYDYDATTIRLNEEACYIKETFELPAAGYGSEQITRHLNAKGFTVSKSGTEITRGTISLFLRNEVYVGDRHLRKRLPKDAKTGLRAIAKRDESIYFKDDLEAIVDRELWNKVQKAIIDRRKLSTF